MNEVSYYGIRARHYRQLANDAICPNLKQAYWAIADDMAAKLAKADPNRRVRVTDPRMPSKQPQSVAPGNARRLSVRSI
jgi:hypothetical protein